MKTRIDFRLYLITDRHLCHPHALHTVLRAATAHGVRAVQLREKDLLTRPLLALAQEIQKICEASHAHLFINDRTDIARAVGAAGVQLTSHSLTVNAARAALSAGQYIGVSTHSVREVKEAENSGADFALFGPVFETPSKKKYGLPHGLTHLQTACRAVSIPVFAVGGINPDRAARCLAAGATGVAVISAIMACPNPKQTILDFKETLGGL